jgi:hypothetical protein
MMKRLLPDDTAVVTRDSGSYAVVWQKDSGPVVAGQIQLQRDAIRLRGAAHGQPVEHALRYDHLSEVRLGHQADERIQGRPSLLLEVCSIERFVVAAISGFGVVAELADLIAAARLA